MANTSARRNSSGTLRAVRTTAGPPLPLRYRLPNPPPVYVGRSRERALLRDALARAPVALVHGESGIGKTALLLATLHREFSHRVARALYIGLRPGDPPEQLRVELLRALSEAYGLRRVDWSRMLTDPEAALAAAIDMAEEADLWLVLDDLQHGEPGVVRETLAQIARYARAARWIGASRVAPTLPELAGQLVPVGPMSPRALTELARRCAPDLDAAAARAAASWAHGSPWALRRRVVGERWQHEAAAAAAAVAEAAPGEYAGALPLSAREFVAALAALAHPHALEHLARFVAVPDEPTRAALAAAGLIVQGPDGVRLHDAARAALAGHGDEPRAWGARAAEALAACDEPIAWLEALRLHLAAGRLDAAHALLERHGAALLERGEAPRVWTLVEPLGDAPRLARWRLRCALELGDPATLARVTAPAGLAPADELLRARALFAVAGRLPEAAQAAAAVRAAAQAQGDPALWFDAGLLESKCLGMLGHAERALDVLAELPAHDADAAALREVYHARWLAFAGRYEPALALAEAAAARRATLGEAAAREVGEQAAGVLVQAGRLRAAHAALRDVAAQHGAEPATLHRSRQLMLCQAIVAVDSGRLAEARELLERLGSYHARASYLRHFLAGVEVHRRLMAGELAGIDGAIERLLAEAEASRYVDNYAWGVVYRERVAMLRGEVCAEPAWPASLPAPAGSRAAHLALTRAQREARRGARVPPEAWPRPEAYPALVQLQAFARVVTAHAALAAGDWATAASEADAAAQLAGAHALGYYEAEARVVGCEALLVGGRREELARAAAALGALGAAFPSARYAAEARFFALASAGGEPLADVGALAALAALGETAPPAARRARALLGDAATLDAIDATVVAAAGRGVRVARVGAPARGDAAREDFRRGWGLDVRSRTVWLPDGRRVEMATRALLWQILAVIAERGGAATKEQLVLAAWGARDYHPLRDDKRLQVAMRKLRTLLEDDPSRPTRLITTPEGYAFGDGEPVRRVIVA